MPEVRIRLCPRCDLRLTPSSELDQHLTCDHQPPLTTAAQPMASTVARIGTRPASAQIPPPAQSASVHDVDGKPPIFRQARLMAWLLFVAGLMVLTLVAWLASSAAVLVAGVLGIALAAATEWRAHAHAGHRPARPRW